VRTLRTLALVDLESHPPPAAIDSVSIVIDPTPARVLQHTLFTRAQHNPEVMSTLLARLGALMGQDRIGAPVLVDTYRPGAFAMAPFAVSSERKGPNLHAPKNPASNVDRSSESRVELARRDPEAHTVVSVLRRFRHAIPARVAVESDRPVRVTTDRRGFAGGSVIASAGPWRTSGNWWAGEAGRAGEAGKAGGAGRAGPVQPFPPILPAWSRDEWDVALSDGAVYRVFQDRETGGWFIDGVVD
jgi:protein ImuB